MALGRSYLLASAAIAALAGYGTSFITTSSPREPSTTASVVFATTAPGWVQPYYTGTLGVMSGKVMVGSTIDGRHGTTWSSTCRLSIVDPVSLRVESSTEENCNDPALDGENAAPVESIVPSGSNYGQVQIAVRDGASDGFTLGPIIMRYGDFSDTRPEWTYGGGYLWLFDAGTEGDGGLQLPPEVLQISATSGQVVTSVPIPSFTRVDLAADDDGLWIALTNESGWQRTSGQPGPLFFVPNGSERVQQINISGSFANWVVASRHTAWVSVTDRVTGRPDIVMLASPTAAPRDVRDTRGTPAPGDDGEGSFDAPPVLEAPGIGLLAPLPRWLGPIDDDATALQVVSLDPDTGGASRLASLSFRPPVESVEADCVYGGALFVLAEAAGSDLATLYRIPL